MLDTRVTTRRRRLPSRLVPLALSLVAWLAVGVAGPQQAQAQTQTGDPRHHHRYLGTWNYDQPVRESMRNIAVVSCPDGGNCRPGPPFHIPQIGTIVFSEAAGGGIVGRTDQGCTWTFGVRSASLELDPPSQRCFNQVIGSAYTLTKWSVTVSGNREREAIEGVSHQPTGDYTFRLDKGGRTRVTGNAWAQAREVFPGTWRYDASDPQSRVNLLTTRYTDPDGQVRVVQAPQQGPITFRTGRGRTMTARTENGCDWTLVARGNTAELEPAGQTCRTARGTTRLTFWAVASDGRHQASIMAGVDESGGSFLLSIGSLTKR
ncbi:hypothetical protein [Sphaerisporangium sp. TRM90804]|uniref:hypothetical protein n=1 Tax=Sphaerisporangium sp. TRM90804 TaxID=3031113 RepID=UPI00244A416A|nr:hypothetical protein [Sphaerisporangium sp. TRM90804]MDH2428423.1 hypothetical protein [Sphaerisporangium sp. TRM90804]